MKILAIDTRDRSMLGRPVKWRCKDAIFEICPQQHSQRILPMIDKFADKTCIKVSDLDALAYGRGPGSFTGVRIATALCKG